MRLCVRSIRARVVPITPITGPALTSGPTPPARHRARVELHRTAIRWPLELHPPRRPIPAGMRVSSPCRATACPRTGPRRWEASRPSVRHVSLPPPPANRARASSRTMAPPRELVSPVPPPPPPPPPSPSSTSRIRFSPSSSPASAAAARRQPGRRSSIWPPTRTRPTARRYVHARVAPVCPPRPRRESPRDLPPRTPRWTGTYSRANPAAR
mmetsp:Transcript_8450/g.38106  ORF Transcript_8450/g.38106 Transcript_8450/m.38106 type:complete len:212 (+) Transcript_8450:91-726(+)